MYLQIENKFKKKSKMRKVETWSILAMVVLAIVCTCLSELFNNTEYYWAMYVLILFVGIVVFSAPWYILLRLKKLTNQQRKQIPFLHIRESVQCYQKTAHEKDIMTLKEILDEHKIDTRPKVEETIRHYQCLLPRTVNQSGTLLSILALAVSILALFASETILKSIENASFVVNVILTIIALYFSIKFTNKHVLRVFTKRALYERMEDALSEIFMTYYSK